MGEVAGGVRKTPQQGSGLGCSWDPVCIFQLSLPEEPLGSGKIWAAALAVSWRGSSSMWAPPDHKGSFSGAVQEVDPCLAILDLTELPFPGLILTHHPSLA